MADILFTCPKCSKNLTIDDKGSGHTIKCPDCQNPIIVPRPTIFLRCPSCNYALSAPQELKGKIRNCPSCNKEVVLFSKVGAGLKSTCPKCNTTSSPDAHFCVKCGMSLKGTSPSATIPPSNNSRKQSEPHVHEKSLHYNTAPKLASDACYKSCPYCGEGLSNGSVFCVNCGSDLRTGEKVRTKNTFAEDPERVLKSVSANLFRGGEAVGGCLKVSSHRLVFESHALNLQSGVISIPLSEIQNVTKCNTLGIIPNGMVVTLRSGVEYQFAVFGRGHLIPLILSLPSHPNIQASTSSFDNLGTSIGKFIMMGVLIVFLFQIFKGCDSSNSSSNSSSSDYSAGEGYDLVQKLMDVENTLGMGVSSKDWDSELNSIIVSKQEHATKDGKNFNSTAYREGWHLGYNKWMKDHPAPPQYRR